MSSQLITKQVPWWWVKRTEAAMRKGTEKFWELADSRICVTNCYTVGLQSGSGVASKSHKNPFVVVVFFFPPILL